MQARPPLIIMKSIEKLHLNASTLEWNRESKDRLVMSRTWTEDAVDAAARVYKPALDFEESELYAVHCRDNLEWWQTVKYAGLRDGVKVSF